MDKKTHYYIVIFNHLTVFRVQLIRIRKAPSKQPPDLLTPAGLNGGELRLRAV